MTGTALGRSTLWMGKLVMWEVRAGRVEPQQGDAAARFLILGNGSLGQGLAGPGLEQCCEFLARARRHINEDTGCKQVSPAPICSALGCEPSRSSEVSGYTAHGGSGAHARERSRASVSLWPLDPLEPPGVVQSCLQLGLEVVSGGHFRQGQLASLSQASRAAALRGLLHVTGQG